MSKQKGFSIKTVTDEEAREYRDCLAAEKRYARLSWVIAGVGAFFIFKGMWLFAFLCFVLANASSGFSYYYWKQARKISRG